MCVIILYNTHFAAAICLVLYYPHIMLFTLLPSMAQTSLVYNYGLLFYKIFVPPLVWLNQSEHDVWLPRCASWRGFNDKIAFVHPRASEQYFTGVLDTYEQHYDDLRCSQDHVSCRYVFQTNNPETFLLQALTFLKVRVERMDPEYLPTFTGRHVNGTVFCFDQYRRQLGRNLDCLPFKDRKIFKSPCHDFALSQEF